MESDRKVLGEDVVLPDDFMEEESVLFELSPAEAYDLRDGTSTMAVGRHEGDTISYCKATT